MSQRGRVLRDTSQGTGLISSDGKQYEFTLEGAWKSDVAPKINQVVEFEVNEESKIVSAKAVSEETLAKEQAEKVMLAAKENSAKAINNIVERVGKPVLIATAALIAGWFFLDIISIQLGRDASVSITFWNLLGIINASGGFQALAYGGSGPKGIYGFFAIAAIAGPFIYQFWKHPAAHLGNCLPLLLIIVAGVSLYMNISNGMDTGQATASFFGGAGAGEYADKLMKEMIEAALKAINIGIGAYIASVASIYLAFVGAKKYLAAKA